MGLESNGEEKEFHTSSAPPVAPVLLLKLQESIRTCEAQCAQRGGVCERKEEGLNMQFVRDI